MNSRRNFLKLSSGVLGATLTGCASLSSKKTNPHVVVIGGGFGGATAAKTIRQLDPTIKVTIIEPKHFYISCPASNWLFAGLATMDDLKLSFQPLKQGYQISVIHEYVINIDPEQQQVHLANQQKIHYDRLIVSPGISFDWQAIEGHNQHSTQLIPHAWQAGKQTQLLLNQIHAMRDGGTVIIVAPKNPFRCPPGPYERASMMASHLKQLKPKSKILILDHKSSFSKQGLFEEGWRQHYGYQTQHSLIEWHSIADNPVVSINPNTKTLETDFKDQFKADVINYIPPQRAAKLLINTGLTDDSYWCPVEPISQESSLIPNIHIIGDAARMSPLPKSAFAASSQAKVCAFAVVNLINDKPPTQPLWINTCYSLVNSTHGISIAMVYKLNEQGQVSKVPGAGGVSQMTDQISLALEAQYAKQWFRNITQDSFG